MSVHIKVCGVCTQSDVEACLEAGVNSVGFNFWPGSKRFVSLEKAAALVAPLPPEVLPVGVFVGASPNEVLSTGWLGEEAP